MDRSTRRDRFLLGMAGGAFAAAVVLLPLAIAVESRLNKDTTDAISGTTAPSDSGISNLDPVLVATGENHFQESCSSCHGPDARGLSGLGKPLIDSDFVNGLSDDDLGQLITVGRTLDDPLNTTGVAMPSKGTNPALTDADIVAIVTFIRSLN